MSSANQENSGNRPGQEKEESLAGGENKELRADQTGQDPPADGKSEAELEEEKRRARREKKEEARKQEARKRSAVQGVLLYVIAFAAVVMVVVSFHLPVLQIYGTSMEPALNAGDMVLCIETKKYSRGDLVAFRVDNKLIVRRVVGLGGEEVDITEDGAVSIDGTVLDEPYAQAADQGKTNIQYPFTVPPGHLFVLCDQRDNIVDSRNSAVGCIDPYTAEGKLIFRMWPAARIGLL